MNYFIIIDPLINELLFYYLQKKLNKTNSQRCYLKVKRVKYFETEGVSQKQNQNLNK